MWNIFVYSQEVENVQRKYQKFFLYFHVKFEQVVGRSLSTLRLGYGKVISVCSWHIGNRSSGNTLSSMDFRASIKWKKLKKVKTRWLNLEWNSDRGKWTKFLKKNQGEINFFTINYYLCFGTLYWRQKFLP